MYGSGQFHTEDYYVAQKLLKGAIGTNNFDANSRLCMSSAVAGYNRSFGSDGPPCCYEDIDHCSLILLIGTNTAECHPVLFDRIKKRKRNVNDNLKVIVIDPRETRNHLKVCLEVIYKEKLKVLNHMGHLECNYVF